ncbi:MAG TPA: sigma-54 dependent transcriptional regulator [Polyangiaceae bacterium]
MQNGAGAVLVVDDDITLARSLSRSLAGFGWEVEVAHDGREALTALQGRAFDALVVDLQMPEGGGLSVIEQVTDGRARPLTILLSGHLEIAATVRAVRLGAYDVLEKPVMAAELDERLRIGLAHRRAVDAAGPDAASRILGETPGIRAVREQVRNVARFHDLSVMLIGEAGTGKQMAAEAIQALSGTTEPFITVNCAAIPEHLFETELFGSEPDPLGQGRSQAGLFELAGAGTIFFDEIADVPVPLQPRLLRVLETRTYRRVGGSNDMEFRARVVSANNPRASNNENILSELYYKLSGFTVLCPALRERVADIDLLSLHFLDQFADHYPGSPSSLTPRAFEALHAYEWPGNVRELRAVVQRAAVLTQGSTIGFEEINQVIRERRAENELRASPASASGLRLESLNVNEPLRVLERRVIEDAWQHSGRNLSAAARKLGLPRTTLRDRLRKYGLR